MKLPLEGLRIVSVEQYGAGPYGSGHLSDMGAEVIKIEHRGGGGDMLPASRADSLSSRFGLSMVDYMTGMTAGFAPAGGAAI